MEITRENYYDFGDAEDIVISNSMLGSVSPWEGGSPAKLRRYFEDREEKKYVMHLEKGKLLHKYLEQRGNFEVDEGIRPSESIVKIIDKVYNDIIAQPGSSQPSPLLETYSSRLVGAAREINWYDNLKDETIAKKVCEAGIYYWEFMLRASGKHLLTTAEKESLDGMVNSLNNSEYYDELMGGVQREIPMTGYWEIPGGRIRTKCLVDRLHVENNILHIDEIKSTSEPVDSYFRYTRYGPDYYTGEVKRIIMAGPFYKYRVYRQLYFYNKIAQSYFPGMQIRNHIYVFETKPPYEIRRFEPPTIDCTDEVMAAMIAVGKYIAMYKVNEF